MSEQVGIVGYGWVGKAMKKLFPEAPVYSHNRDLDGNRVSEEDWLELAPDFKKQLNLRTVVFICVPTPCPNEGPLDTSGVEDAIEWCQAELLVVRSTVNPHDCDRWQAKYNKHICMQPEYLGETPQHPLNDNNQFMVIGGDQADRERLITLYTTVYNANIKIRQVTNYEAGIIKLTENRAIAFKVAQCQELYDACKAADVDYYTIRDAVYGDDPRFNLWWTFIFPDKRGFNSKCIPKDIYAWCAWAESCGYEPKITRSILLKNKEWLKSNPE